MKSSIMVKFGQWCEFNDFLIQCLWINENLVWKMIISACLDNELRKKKLDKQNVIRQSAE